MYLFLVSAHSNYTHTALVAAHVQYDYRCYLGPTKYTAHIYSNLNSN